ncbi:2-desacetyl-2-hydroxyethyl bacteriochlorophyllide A dehydrogenase [Leucobacter exalbidus]|uniref:2-desacetyl-2-hydroxyethyl bacteriochlorophyllide A dehydrogenase n=1 Tax=Leucobacter exalbidus TaxID=662960 RepID=A0A940T4G6_9MICO|nr:alcohol dehydrogenase catalytic domain-containing protein [Leucobacter exalbidus]MBP1326804.1 2-desacetyl-2-hydroxyethyl bacteriochlorophyllide A dehydrogenase [Leucobacter exalbidus]
MARENYAGGGRAAQYIGDGDMRVVDQPVPTPGPGQVRIKVAFCGICGTDLHILHGNMDSRVETPQAIGHEMSGTIDAVGEGVTALAPGAGVTVMPLDWCGTCPACEAGHQHICQNLDFVGIETTGAMQQFWVVPESLVVPLPEGLALDHAALIEPLAVAAHDVRRSRLTAGETAVIVGGGPIGQLISLVAQGTGARVILAEPNADRRAFAERNGAQVVNPVEENLAAIVEAETGGAGADVVFEVAGIAATALEAPRLARTRGRVVMVAIHAQPVPIDLHRVFWRELELIGARVYEREDFERAIELLASGHVPADELITRKVPLAETKTAFNDLTDARALKVLIDVQN